MFDDIPLAAYFDSSLTTVRLPAYDQGKITGERWVHLITVEELEKPGYLLSIELIVRESTPELRIDPTGNFN